MLRTGRMGPVEKNHACLSALVKLQVEGRVSAVGAGCTVLGTAWHQEPSQAAVRVCSTHGMGWALPSTLMAWCLCPEGTVPAERFTLPSLLHPLSSAVPTGAAPHSAAG